MGFRPILCMCVCVTISIMLKLTQMLMQTHTQTLRVNRVLWSIHTDWKQTRSNLLLPPASKGWGKVMFSVCSPWVGGTPVPGSFQGLWCQVLSRGYPLSWLGEVPQDRLGRVPQDRGYPPARTGYHPPPPETGYTAGGMPRAVSRRRTFLLTLSRDKD